MDIFLKHNIHCLDDPKLKKLVRTFHAFGYAVFFRSVEALYLNEGNPISKDDLIIDIMEGLRESDQQAIRDCINEAVEIGLFIEEDDVISSLRVKKDYKNLTEMRVAKSEAGKKGMANRWNNKKDNKVITPVISKLQKKDNKDITLLLQTDNYEDEEEDEEEDEDEEDSKKEIEKKKNTFTPPSIEEIKTYFKEKGSTESEAESFYNFYESKGWYVGKNKMQKWHSAASGWMGRNINGPRNCNPSTKFKPKDLGGNHRDAEVYYIDEF